MTIFILVDFSYPTANMEWTQAIVIISRTEQVMTEDNHDLIVTLINIYQYTSILWYCKHAIKDFYSICVLFWWKDFWSFPYVIRLTLMNGVSGSSHLTMCSFGPQILWRGNTPKYCLWFKSNDNLIHYLDSLLTLLLCNHGPPIPEC